MKYFREMEMGVFIIRDLKQAKLFPVTGLYLCCLGYVWDIFSSVFLWPHSFTSLQASAQNDSLSVTKGYLSIFSKIATHLLHSSFVSCFIFLNGTYHYLKLYIC